MEVKIIEHWNDIDAYEDEINKELESIEFGSEIISISHSISYSEDTDYHEEMVRSCLIVYRRNNGR